ncbi:hypothetical protein C3B55_00543 [Candidatus Pseudomonas adelgestsugas]|uniref:Uncharacterized protein n=1 Tax=Candidatus Pseudomonas adelgestsugas TaxID=1302376 RepID=A0ABX5R8X5_9PSED|nr:hypothetical protein C3B55_00543 [Candidatus Pseudomonas adelgestsugas]
MNIMVLRNKPCSGTEIYIELIISRVFCLLIKQIALFKYKNRLACDSGLPV